MEDNKSPTFVDYLTVIVKRRRFIIKTVLIVTAAALIISLIIPPQYTATATILPPNPQQDAMIGLLPSTVLTGFSGLSGLSGIVPGAVTPSDLFAAILRSEKISGEIIRKYHLKKVFKTKTIDATYKKLKGITKIGVTPEGIITISVTWYDKYLAADIANSLIEELDKFNTETAMTVGKKFRIFMEQRLKENEATMKETAENLRKFQEKHRTIDLEIEVENVIATVAELKSEVILLEAKKAALSSSSQFNNPYLRDINKELRALKKQLTKIEFGDTVMNKKEFGVGFAIPFSQLPKVALEYAKLVKDVEVQAIIFELLTQQYEQARIMELKDTPTVEFLDIAIPPERKSTPKRANIVIFAVFFSILLGVITSFLLESFEQHKKRPEEYRKWSTIYYKIKNDFVNVKKWVLKLIKKKK